MFSRPFIALVLLCVTGLGVLGEAAAVSEAPPCGDDPTLHVDLDDDCAKPLCPPVLCWPCPMASALLPKVHTSGIDLLS